MKRFFGRREKLATKETELKERIGKASILVYSPEFKRFVGENKPVLSQAYKLVRENFERLERDEEIVDEKTGIRIVRAATGSYKGRVTYLTFKILTYLTLKVTAGSKEFFVKFLSSGFEARCCLAGYKRANAFLKQRNYSFLGYNVRVIKPHLLIAKSRSLLRGEAVYGILVTDFYSPGEVVQVSDFAKTQLERISGVVDDLSREMLKAGVDVSDVTPKNAFFESRTNTILLFDISVFSP